MFGTFILDAYVEEESTDIAVAIEDICSPNDNFGWASSGLYSFWDYYTKEIYYIGYSTDLHLRFMQHNGLIPVRDSVCKEEEICEYFKKNNKIGFSIFVQSPFSQPRVYRNKSSIIVSDITNEQNSFLINDLRIMEGSFISAYENVKGYLPEWNKIGGSPVGGKRTEGEIYEQMIERITGNLSDMLVARSSIRELSKNSKYEFYEVELHGVRSLMINFHLTFNQAIKEMLNINPFFFQYYNEILLDQYLYKNLDL
ncbi:MAG: GIY-YIG nuclease family protein [Eubacteriales bacterium]